MKNILPGSKNENNKKRFDESKHFDHIQSIPCRQVISEKYQNNKRKFFAVNEK